MFFISKKSYPSQIGTHEPVESCIIFVHGFAGGISTWKTFAKHLKKQWIYEDSFGIEYDQYTVGFNFPLFTTIGRAIAGGPKLEILATSFNTVINEVCNEYKNVIIIAHSMGGLIARQYLVDVMKRNKDVGKIKALITYASPHKGSLIATFYKSLPLKYFFPFRYMSEQVVQMCRIQSDFIYKLNKDWDKLRIEKKIDFRRVIGERDGIVDRESGALELSLFDSISNKGHFNIIKPSKSKDPAFMVTFNYLRDFRINQERKVENEELNELSQND